MSPKAAGLSDNSRRIAKNTLLLYFRMLLLILIGLFTSRVVLDALGVEDYGVYNAVGGAVALFTFISSSISSAISRFISFELGRGDQEKLRRVFCAGVVIQLVLSAAIVLLVETLGMWFLRERMVIPEGRERAAAVVLHCSLGVLVLNLLSVPYNATIVSREKMSAFALISLVEAGLKLSVALLLYVSVFDKLETYALLMLAVAVVVRGAYSLYCRRHFPESRGRLSVDWSLVREMSGFAGWSFFGTSAYVFNTQGVNLVVNLFFGVAVNAARGVASQVEGIARQFVANFLTAINPQITKSWASGDKEYSFELVRKGAKYSYLVILAFFIPLLFEAETVLGLWLVEVPPMAASFVRLSLAGLLVDLTGNSLLTLVLASGKVRKYYLITGLGIRGVRGDLFHRPGAQALACAVADRFPSREILENCCLASCRGEHGIACSAFSAALLHGAGTPAGDAGLPCGVGVYGGVGVCGGTHSGGEGFRDKKTRPGPFS